MGNRIGHRRRQRQADYTLAPAPLFAPPASASWWSRNYLRITSHINFVPTTSRIFDRSIYPCHTLLVVYPGFYVLEVPPNRSPSADFPKLWEIRPTENNKISDLPAITYGVVPAGFTQTIPSSGPAPPLVEKKTYEAGGPAFDANSGPIWLSSTVAKRWSYKFDGADLLLLCLTKFMKLLAESRPAVSENCDGK